MSTFDERVAYIIKQAGGVVKCAEITGISRRTLSNYLNGESEPGRTNIMKMAEVGKVCTAWLLNDKEGMACWEDPTWLKRANANLGIPPSPSDLSQQPASPAQDLFQWLMKNLDRGGHGMEIIKSRCEAMRPTLNPGDLVLVDTTQTEITDDSIYLIKINGRRQARRIQTLSTGQLKVICDNAAYQEEIFPGATLDDAIAGKVVGVIRSL